MSLLHLEPVGWYEEGIGLMDEKHFDSLQPVYTEAQLKAELLAERERCAKVCEEVGNANGNQASDNEAYDCAAAIRSMK